MLALYDWYTVRKWYVGYLFRTFKRYLKERKEHFKSCFEKIEPSENNYTKKPRYQFQCNEYTCGKVFFSLHSDTCCPYCGSYGFTPISGVRKNIVYDEDKLYFEKMQLEPVVKKLT